MPYQMLADLLLVVHGAFVLFVVLGGALVWLRPRAAWLHLPAVVWGVGIEWTGAICPLTPLEQWLRARAGVGGYEGTFIEHYVWPLLYPAALTRSDQLVLGAAALAVNAAAYGWLWLGAGAVARRGLREGGWGTRRSRRATNGGLGRRPRARPVAGTHAGDRDR